MTIPESFRSRIFNGCLPTYLADDEIKIVAMNAAFRCLTENEWGCTIGMSGFDIVERLDNRDEVQARADEFFGPGTDPQVDHEYCRFISGKYGKVELHKCATKFSGADGEPNFWMVQFNILSAERLSELFSDIMAAIESCRNERWWQVS